MVGGWLVGWLFLNDHYLKCKLVNDIVFSQLMAWSILEVLYNVQQGIIGHDIVLAKLEIL